MLRPYLLSEPPSPLGGEQPAQQFCPGFQESRQFHSQMVLGAILWDEVGVLKSTQHCGEMCPLPLCFPNLCPSLSALSQPSCLKTSRLQLFPRKPGTQLQDSPRGEFLLSLLAPDVKEQLRGWREAQLAAKQGPGGWRTKRVETDNRQGCHNSGDLEGEKHFVPWPGNWLTGLAKPLRRSPSPAHPNPGSLGHRQDVL